MSALEREARSRLPSGQAEALVRAVRLAGTGWGRVHPNPMVGCVLSRDGKEVGRGAHGVFGGAHAEVEALKAAGEATRGATAFVSLEPCRHHGKTPPCTRALQEAGVARVVYGAADPTDEAGGGGAELRRAGVEVVGPVFSRELARHLDPVFFHRARSTRRPYLALKLAVTLDGKIAARDGKRTLITGEAAVRYTHRLRSGFDALLVGAGTVRVDDPLLTVRGGVEPRVPPRRLVVDSMARSIEPGCALLRDAPGVPLHLFCRHDAPHDRIGALEDQGVRVHPVPEGPQGLELDAVLRVSGGEGMDSILCEGGARLASSLVELGLVDRLYLYLAPKALGPHGVPAFLESVPVDAWRGWRVTSVETLDPDALVVLDREEP